MVSLTSSCGDAIAVMFFMKLSVRYCGGGDGRRIGKQHMVSLTAYCGDVVALIYFMKSSTKPCGDGIGPCIRKQRMISLTSSCALTRILFQNSSMKLWSRSWWEPVSIASEKGEGWRRILQFTGGYYMPLLLVAYQFFQTRPNKTVAR
jgi:hypothetical protein